MKMIKLALPAALALMLSACGGDEAPAAGGQTPQAQVAPAKSEAQDPASQAKMFVGYLRSNNIAALLKAGMPPEKYAEMKKNFADEMAKQKSPEEQKEFEDNIAKLTGPGAVDKLMADIEPQLAQMGMMAPMMISQGLTGLEEEVNNEQSSMSKEQRELLKPMLPGLKTWATSTNFADAALVRQALTIFADAVKDTGITTMADVQKLSFEEALGKAGILVGAVKGSLNVYGIDLNAMLDSAKFETVSQSGDTARVKGTFTLFGAPISSESEMVKVGGIWLPKEAADKLKEAAGSGAAP
jgi:hypothetical protein